MEIPKSSSVLIKGLDINGFQLVIMLSKRSKELMFGAKPLVDNKGCNYTETATKELLSGKIKPQV